MNKFSEKNLIFMLTLYSYIPCVFIQMEIKLQLLIHRYRRAMPHSKDEQHEVCAKSMPPKLP